MKLVRLIAPHKISSVQLQQAGLSFLVKTAIVTSVFMNGATTVLKDF